MIQTIKKNFLFILITLLVLIVVNSFIKINKNFSKVHSKIQIKFSVKEDYELQQTNEILARLKIDQDLINNVIKDINTDYSGSKKNFNMKNNKITHNFSTSNFLVFENENFFYDKFNKNDYNIFLKKNFKKYLYNRAEFQKNDYIRTSKEIISSCLIQVAAEKFRTKEKFIALIDEFNEIYDSLYLEFLPFYTFRKKTDVSYNLIICLKKSYLDFYYLSKYNNLMENINFEIVTKFENYKNNKLIYFINIIILMSFIFVNFCFVEIKKIRNKYQSK